MLAPDKLTGIFSSPKDQLQRVHDWNSRQHPTKWVFPSRKFEKLEQEIPQIPGDRAESGLVTIVLDIRLDTLEATFNAALTVAKRSASIAIETASWLKADAEHMRASAHWDFQPGLRWRVIDLGANQDMPPRRVQEGTQREHLPSSAIMWCCALHPFWLHAMDGDKIPFVVAAGCEMKGPGLSKEWTHALGIWKEPSGTGTVHILPTSVHCRNPQWAVPVLLA